MIKNQNLKSKHWGHNLKCHQNLNWMVKLKRKFKLTKESKIKKIRTEFKKIKTKIMDPRMRLKIN